MACVCSTFENHFAIPCEPTIGGVASVVIKNAYVPSGSSEPATDLEVDVLPESSTFNAVLNYNRTTNIKYWQTEVTLHLGAYTAEAAAFVDALPCKSGRTIELTLFNGDKVTIEDAFIQTATFNPGPLKSDGTEGVVVFAATTKDAPTVTPHVG